MGLLINYKQCIHFVAFLDFTNTSQSLQFRAGENCVDIQILEDFEVEGREVFNTHLAIATSTGAKVLHTCHRIYIDDNDGEWLHVVALSILGFFFLLYILQMHGYIQ